MRTHSSGVFLFSHPQFGLNCVAVQIPVKSVPQTVPLNFLSVPTAVMSIFQFATAATFCDLGLLLLNWRRTLGGEQ